MTALRDRCKAFIAEQARNGMLRVGNPVDDLLAFVLAETGRAADQALEPTLPLVLYFGNEADRDEFIALVGEYKPMIARKMP